MTVYGRNGVAGDDVSVARQRAVADAAHAGGGEVLFSCHAHRALGPDEVVALAAEAESRGADLFKLVAAAPTTEDALALVAGAVRLRRQRALPATIVASGRAGRFTRVLAPVLGAGWALCQEDILAGAFAEQPPVGETRDVLRVLSALVAVPGG